MKNRTTFVTIALGIILIILSIVHFIIYEGLVVGFQISQPELIEILRIVFVMLTLSFVLASILSYKFNNIFTRIFYRISAAWLGFSVYFFLAACIYIVYLDLGPVSTTGASVLFIIAACIGLYGVIHAEYVVLTKISPALQQTPEVWKHKKIVFISDLHLGQVHGISYVQKIIKKIEKIKPDILFIGGDVYDGVCVNEKDVVTPFAKLMLPLGIYVIMGNHEEFTDNTKYISALKNAGMNVLLDEVTTIQGLQIVGVDYKTTVTEEKFKTVLETISLDPRMPSILLKHVPLHIHVGEEKGISLQLSGHSHKAQLFPFSLLTIMIFQGFDYGLKCFKNMPVYTSSGVGTWGPPLRVGTRSEIVVITLT